MTTASQLLSGMLVHARPSSTGPDKCRIAALRSAVTGWLARSGIDPTNDLSPAQCAELTEHLRAVAADLDRQAPIRSRQSSGRRAQIIAGLRRRAEELADVHLPGIAAVVSQQLERFLANRVDSRAKGAMSVDDVVLQLGDLLTVTVCLHIMCAQREVRQELLSDARAALADPDVLHAWQLESPGTAVPAPHELVDRVIDGLQTDFSVTRATTTGWVPTPVSSQLREAGPVAVVMNLLRSEVTREAFPFGLAQHSSRCALAGFELVLGGRMRASRPIEAARAAVNTAADLRPLALWRTLVGILQSPTEAESLSCIGNANNTWDLIVATAALQDIGAMDAGEIDGWNPVIAGLLFCTPALRRLRAMLPLDGTGGPRWWRSDPTGVAGFTTAGRQILDLLASSGLDAVNQENLLHGILGRLSDELHRALVRLEREGTPFEFRGMMPLNRFVAERLHSRVVNTLKNFRRQRSTADLDEVSLLSAAALKAIPEQVSLEDDLDQFLSNAPRPEILQQVVLNLTGVAWAMSRLDRFQHGHAAASVKTQDLRALKQTFLWWNGEHQPAPSACSPESVHCRFPELLIDRGGPLGGDTTFAEIFRRFTDTPEWFQLRGIPVDLRTKQRDRRAWSELLCMVLTETVR